jgi:hypothetical protein
MKIILEFGDEETQEAELACKGTKFSAAAETFRNSLRTRIKYGQHSEEVHKVIKDIYDDFLDDFNGLLEE